MLSFHGMNTVSLLCSRSGSLNSNGGHLENSLFGLSATNKAGGVNEDAAFDAGKNGEVVIALSPPGLRQREAVLERFRRDGHALDSPAGALVLEERILDVAGDSLFILEIFQVRLPRTEVGQDDDLARWMHARSLLQSLLDNSARGQPGLHDRSGQMLEIVAGDLHRLCESLIEIHTILVPCRVEPAHARSQISGHLVVRLHSTWVFVHSIVDAVDSFNKVIVELLIDLLIEQKKCQSLQFQGNFLETHCVPTQWWPRGPPQRAPR